MNTRKIISTALFLSLALSGYSQKATEKAPAQPNYKFTTVKENPITSIKDQAHSGTCWAFSATSFLESEAIKKGTADTTLNLSEMWTVAHSYSDKAEKFVRLYGNLNFGGGSDFGDVFYDFAHYGAVPDSLMAGLNYGSKRHNHSEMDAVLKGYVEAEKNISHPTTAWKRGFDDILGEYLGAYPHKFTYKGKEYTPKTFAASLKLDMEDYVSITSYTHHPFYSSFIIEVPDNWRWDKSYNVPIDDIIKIIDNAINKGYTVAWGADVSEKGFTRNGIATVPEDKSLNKDEAGTDKEKWVGKEKDSTVKAKQDSIPTEKEITQEMRQKGYDQRYTTDDHGMQIFGIAKDQNGTKYYMVKNSWGKVGKYKGIWYVSESYVKYKTMNFVVNKHALPKDIRKKLGL
ncbi:MAG: aminopeptidase [Bacteroidales bacterium]|jgi:aminopeptidase C|nr:aminopeptidase [Bacteroidales bacterium]